MNSAPAISAASVSIPITGCRLCGSTMIETVLSFGKLPLANAFLSADELNREELRIPLDVAFCMDCSLLQITETVRPDILFTDYPYLSSFADTFVQSASHLVDRMVQELGLGQTSQVVEIASNDGYLLQFYVARGVPVFGVDPAVNAAARARDRGVATHVGFFDRRFAAKLVGEGMRADVIHANNVLAHVPDLTDLVGGIRLLLKPDGVAVIEVPYVRDLIEHAEFDTVYHEHLCYFSVTTLVRLFEQNGLCLVDADRIPLHGGSLRLFVRHPGHSPLRAVERYLAEERTVGLTSLRYYAAFAARAQRIAQDLRHLLHSLKSGGARLAAYGASAKGTILLNFSGIGCETLDFVADRSTVKQGRYVPGVHLPVVAPVALLERRPGYALLLAWNFAEEIVAQQAEYVRRGGKFIIPIPTPRVL
jgi:SAM-dependent methyltransferase